MDKNLAKHMSSDEHLGYLPYIRDLITQSPSYIGIIKNHYEDQYEPTSTLECQKGFERCSQVITQILIKHPDES